MRSKWDLNWLDNLMTRSVTSPEGWAALGRLAAQYDEEGGGGDQFRAHMRHSPHTRSRYKLTAAHEARQMDYKFHPWRIK